MSARKLGARPRTFDPTFPHAATLRMMAGKLPPIPDKLDLLDGMPDDLGMMNNDRLGCCTAAAAYHAMQVWSHHGRDVILTEPDQYVERMYREFAGYDGTPATDQGAVEQDVLRQWLQKGAPIKEGSTTAKPGRSFIKAAMEIDPHNIAAVKRAIYDCGGVYIGFEVPGWLMDAEPPDFWENRGHRNLGSVGGHAVSGHAYDDTSVGIISWGRSRYRMSWDMWADVVQECYALIHPWWIEATGKTPFGLSVDQLSEQMTAFCRGHIPK